MKVKVSQKEGFHFMGSGGEFATQLPIDAAAHVGGKGRGYRPPELLMYSIAGCMGIHTFEALHEAGKHVEDLEVETDGVRQETHPKVYTKIALKFRLKGKGLTDKDVKDAIEVALHKTCSIAAMVNRVAPISYEYHLT
mgnify:CR=1 FL=1|jgi:putative redox protein